MSARRGALPGRAGGAARHLAPAVAIGAGAGGIAVIDGPMTVLVVATALTLALFVVVGLRSLSVAAWGAAAFTAPLSGIRVSALALSDVAVIIAVGLTLASLVARRRPDATAIPAGPLAGLGAIALGGVVATIHASDPSTGLAGVTTFVLGSAGPVVAMALWSPTRPQLRWFTSLWLAGAVTSALWAILVGPAVFGRRAGLTTHPNHLGIVCVLATGLALGMLVTRARQARAPALVALPPLLAALVLSGSRAAVVGVVAVVVAMAWLCRRFRLALRALAVVVAFGVIVLGGLVEVPEQSGLGRLAGGRSSSESDTARAENLARSLERLERHPFTGEGFEFAEEAHNIYLQVAVAAGPLGVIGLVLVAGGVLRAIRLGAWSLRRPVRGDRALLAGLGAGYTGYLVAGTFQNLLRDRYLWLYVAAALSLSSRLVDDARREPAALADRGHVDGPDLPGASTPTPRHSSGIRPAR